MWLNEYKSSSWFRWTTFSKQISLKYSNPIITTYLGVDFFNIEFENYFGVVGLKATRVANLLVNNSDLVICIGTRLATSVIGFEYDLFAPNAKKIIVDIDQLKSSMTLEVQKFFPLI